MKPRAVLVLLTVLQAGCFLFVPRLYLQNGYESGSWSSRPVYSGTDSDDSSGVLWNALFMRVEADCMLGGQPNHGWQLCFTL